MNLRACLIHRAKGDHMGSFWRLYRLRAAARSRVWRGLLSLLLLRSARRHGGYVGPGAVIHSRPILPHGLHGIFISQYAEIGENCRIYQNVTIGEVDGKAPQIGPDCWIGAGAVLVGNIQIGRAVKIGAGAVVCKNIPAGCPVVAQPARIIQRSPKALEPAGREGAYP